LLNNRQAAVLVAREAGGQLEILVPESGGTRALELAQLEEEYPGFALFVQSRCEPDARTELSGIPRSKHWFWSALSQSWPIYGEALLASFLINLFALVAPFFSMNIYDRVVPNLTL